MFLGEREVSVMLGRKDRRYTERLITRNAVNWFPLSVLPAPAPWLIPSTNIYKSPTMDSTP